VWRRAGGDIFSARQEGTATREGRPEGEAGVTIRELGDGGSHGGSPRGALGGGWSGPGYNGEPG
jgi:hypothetical protein